MDDKMVYSYIDEIGKRLADPGLYGAASLMVGAGFSKNADCIGDKKNTPPDWTQLSETMYEELYPSEKDNQRRRWEECSGKNVLTLAQKYEVTFDRQSLNSLIERSIADKNYIPGELHRNLLELNWNDVFTTNYDTLLERAIEQVATRKNYKIVYSQDDLPGSVRPRLVKLHGSIEHSSQYIITEEDYRTYPDKYAPFVNTVQQSMLETRLCLIGFSGADPNFLNWLGWLRDNMGENCPAIYFCGLFDNLGTAERKMLEQRHITILDLSVLVDKTEKSKHYTAIKKFIELLKQKSEKKKENILTQRLYEYVDPWDKKSKLDMSKYAIDMKDVVNHLIDKLDDYVCLPQNEANNIGIQIDEGFTDEHEKNSIVNDALRIIYYSFNRKIFNGCIDYILDNKLLDYRFTSYFDDVDYGLEDADEQRIKEKLITSMKKELDSEDHKIRDNAVNKFKLFEKILIDSEYYQQILDKVWSQVDEFGLPLNSTYLPIAWVEDKKHEAEEKIIAYLLNPQISSDYHEGVINSGGNADGQVQGYCTVLYRMLKIKNNNIFSGEQLCDIVKYFNDYVKNEKKIVDRDFDIMGQSAQTKDRLNRINNIVMLLCISAKVSNLYSEEFRKIVDAFLMQMDEIKIHTGSIKMLLGNIDANIIFAEFEKMILGGDEKEISAAFIMLYGSVQILHCKNEEATIDNLIIQFIQRMPYLEMRIGKRIMLELHNVLRRKIFLDKENIKYVVNMMKLCYEIFKKAKGERMKDGLDGMYNVSNLAKTYYGFLKENSIKIGSDFEMLISDFRECKLNEIKFEWL